MEMEKVGFYTVYHVAIGLAGNGRYRIRTSGIYNVNQMWENDNQDDFLRVLGVCAYRITLFLHLITSKRRILGEVILCILIE